MFGHIDLLSIRAIRFLKNQNLIEWILLKRKMGSERDRWFASCITKYKLYTSLRPAYDLTDLGEIILKYLLIYNAIRIIFAISIPSTCIIYCSRGDALWTYGIIRVHYYVQYNNLQMYIMKRLWVVTRSHALLQY